MTTLGIFTVKKLRRHDGSYYTYGGFGDYLAAMRSRFERIVLVAHVDDASPPQGHYQIRPGPDLQVVHLPTYKSELGALLTLPIMFWRSWQAAKRIDIAHARMPDYTGVVGAFVCRLQDVPVFCQVIDDWFLQAKQIPVMRKYGLGLLLKPHLYFYDLCERLVCRGQMVFAQGTTCYEKHRRSSDCKLVLSTAHHLSDIATPQSRFRRRPYTILTVARLNSVKNQQLTVRALGRLCAAGEDWRLVLVGEGNTRSAIEELATSLGVRERLLFAGQVERGSVLWKFFDDADCFVLSSRSEGTPKVLLEAMARGLPVIAPDVAGVPSIVGHDERGLLFQDNDVNGLMVALRRMANDKALRDALTRNGQAFALEHTVERATDRMLENVFARWPQLAPHQKADPLCGSPALQ
jgi:phosphatidylinositol alpha-1,6-mannosyltransferase